MREGEGEKYAILKCYQCCVLMQSNVVHNQPYDESVEVSDGEDIASATASPRVPHAPPPGGGGAQQGTRMYVYIHVHVHVQWNLSL